MIKPLRNEKGIALLVSLMVLIMLTLIGMAAILTTTTEVNIAGNEKKGTQALYLAEAGISRVKAFFENPSSFNPPAGSIECLNKDDGTIIEANCNTTNHTSQTVNNTWPGSFFERRRLDTEGAPSFIGTNGSQFLDIDNALPRNSNNVYDDGSPTPPDQNTAVDGDLPAMRIIGDAYINDTLLGGAFRQVGTIESIEIYPPFSDTNYAVVRVTACTSSVTCDEAGVAKRIVEQEIGPSIFIAINGGAQAGGAGRWNGNGTIHWGAVKVEGNLDNFNPNNTPANQYCADTSCGEGDLYGGLADTWFEVEIGGNILDDNPNPTPCTISPTCDDGRPYLNFDIYPNQPDVQIDELDYGEVKKYAQDNGSYYVICNVAGDNPTVDSNDAVFFQGGCTGGQGRTFDELTKGQSYDFYFIERQGASSNTPPASANFTLRQAGNYATSGNLYLNGNVEWNSGGGAVPILTEDPNGVKSASTTCLGVAAGCMQDVNINGLLYATGQFSGAGSPTIYGALVAEGGLMSAGNPQIYYNALFQDGILNLPRVSKRTWREGRE